MINILVVDDNAARVEETRNILGELDIPNDHVTYVDSTMDAKRAMLERQYDVLLLDIVLPTRRDTEPTANGGIDLLYEIVTLDTYKTPLNVFVISEFDDAIKGMESVTREIVCSIIKYDCASEDWKNRLRNYMDQIIKAETKSKDYDYDVAILCALATPELAEVKQLPFEWCAFSVWGDATDYFIGSYKGKKLVCAASYEMGLSSAAVLATKMTATFRPRYLIMTGIAGGVDKKKLDYGDVMVADPCFDYESGKKEYVNGQSMFKPDYRQIRMDSRVDQIVRRLLDRADLLGGLYTNCKYEKPDHPFKIKIGPFGSGAAVLSDQTVIKRVTEHNRKFLGFDMEAYAVMLAGSLSSAPKTIPIVMKAVSDFGTGKTDKYQKYAAYTSAQVLQCFLDELFSE